MPLENGYGPGGLLTTVEDLLIWNRALDENRLGPFVTAELQRPTVLNDGTTTQYARGLYLTSYRTFREVSHPGGTGGYRAWDGCFPDQALSIALLCNAGNDDQVTLAHAVADLYLPRETPSPPPTTVASTQPKLAAWAGWCADDRWGLPLHLIVDGAACEAGIQATGS